MDTKHTPGPWNLTAGRTFETQSGVFHLAYFTDKHGNANFPNFCELDRNAELIAAAPDLLAACVDALKIIEVAYNAEGDVFGIHHNDATDALSALEAAIAKAKGATS